MLDIIKLYHYYKINYRDRGHKHCRSGWVQVKCPFCTGNPGYHLGYCIDPASKFAGSFVCWRCGGKNIKKVLQILLKIPKSEIKETVSMYQLSGYSGPRVHHKINIKKGRFKYPTQTDKMNEFHREYLSKRGFDPEYLEREWELLGTGPLSTISYRIGRENKVLSFSNRILIPIKNKNKIVTYQGRHISKKAKIKYLACPEAIELTNIKQLTYGKSNGEICALVEGATDVWRLGFGSETVFGIKFTSAQINRLRSYKKIFLIFDPEDQAQKQAKKAQASLNFRGVKTELVDWLDTDPGDMKQDDANHLMRNLGLKK